MTLSEATLSPGPTTRPPSGCHGQAMASQRGSYAGDDDDLLAFHRSTASDPADVRYLHGYPSQVPGLLAAEALWVPRALRARAWTLPAEGELHVAGWLLGDGWAVWLGEVGQDPKTGANGGRASAALVRWTSSGSFSLRPAAGGMSYRIERGASVATGETYDEVTVSL